MSKYVDAHISSELPAEEQPEHMGVESGAYIHWMVEYVCQHREPVKLLFCGAEGTGYENFIHNMVELEVESTFRYMGDTPPPGVQYLRIKPVSVSYHLPVVCWAALLRSWFTIFHRNRPCGM